MIIICSRSALKDILEWTNSRNHTNIKGLERVNSAMLDAYGEFPKGQGMGIIEAFWRGDVEFEATEDEVNLMFKAVLDNHMMEDAQYPRRPMDLLKSYGGRYPR